MLLSGYILVTCHKNNIVTLHITFMLYRRNGTWWKRLGGESSVEFKSATILRICLGSEGAPWSLTHKKAAFRYSVFSHRI